MAKIVETKTDDTGREYYVYNDGVEKWKDNGHFRKASSDAMITTENASQLATLRWTQKREAVLRGAAHTLEATGEFENPTSADVAEALGQVVMERAMDSDYKNSKQIEAARFILNKSGMAEGEPEPGNSVSPSDIRQLILALADLAHGVQVKTQEPDRDVIDGVVK